MSAQRANRTTTHRGKAGNAKHNSHDFMDKEKKNITGYNFCQFENIDPWDLKASELEFYSRRYSEMLRLQNEKYMKKRNYSRCKTIDEFYESNRYKPTEEIEQYGYVGGRVPDKETYRMMMNEYIKWKKQWSKEHGGYLHILNFVNHFDESTPHTHIREIWDYKDEDGVIRIGQEKAMELAGIELPKPDKKVSRYNNRNITFTAMCREKWQDICEKYGYEVERTPLSKPKKNQTIEQYKAEQDREYEKRKKELDMREIEIKRHESDFKHEVDEIYRIVFEDAQNASEGLTEAQKIDAIIVNLRERANDIKADESWIEHDRKHYSELVANINMKFKSYQEKDKEQNERDVMLNERENDLMRLISDNTAINQQLKIIENECLHDYDGISHDFLVYEVERYNNGKPHVKFKRDDYGHILLGKNDKPVYSDPVLMSEAIENKNAAFAKREEIDRRIRENAEQMDRDFGVKRSSDFQLG